MARSIQSDLKKDYQREEMNAQEQRKDVTVDHKAAAIACVLENAEESDNTAVVKDHCLLLLLCYLTPLHLHHLHL